ncbi:MAG: YkuS family protein [Firmicutes bacterium]|nr:YkuS family protein [Bacillota bacterium]
MPKTVAVENHLAPVRKLLEQDGFRIVGMELLAEADAVVVAGTDDNLMNIQTRSTNSPVILAEGRTPEEVLGEIRERLR